MHVSEKVLKITTQIFLLAVIVIIPFIKTDTLYFPFVSGKAYLLRFLVAIAFFFWVWLMLKGKEYRPDFKNILVAAIPLFFLAQVIASFFGVDPIYSLFSSIERADGALQYGFWGLYFLMIVSIFKKIGDWKILFSTFVLVAIVLSVKSWLDYSAGAQLAGVFGNPSYFAAFLLFAIGFSLITVERKFFNSPWIQYAFLGAAGFFAFTLFFTQTRGVYVALAGAIFLFCTLAILFLRKENKRLAFASAGILLLGLVSLSVLFAAKETEFVQNTRVLYRITEVTEIWEKGSTRERVLNWSIALKAFKERPIFGYGPENYGSAANKYYDYRIGVGEPWFDRAHNQPLDTLATGGIVVFAAYLFLLGAAIFLMYKIARERKVLSFLLASMFFAYFVQGLFLFDVLAVYLGLFPFLAFLIFQYNEIRKEKDAIQPNVSLLHSTDSLKLGLGQRARLYILIPVALLLSLFIVYTTVFIPYKANAAAIKFYSYTTNGYYKESRPFLDESFSINSPYTSWEVRKRAGWQFVGVLSGIGEETDPVKIKEIGHLYDFITKELEKFIDARPHDPQMYFVLGRMYRFGSEKLGKDDLGKAEAVLQKSFAYSDLRIEYFNEFTQVMLAQGKFKEAEQVVKDYAARVTYEESFPYITLGHFYFVAEEYEKAIAEYEKARAIGYKFSELELDYNRYRYAAQEIGDYQRIVDVATEFLEIKGPNADAYFSVAVGYFNLGNSEQATKFFLRAVALDPAYEVHRSSFLSDS